MKDLSGSEQEMAEASTCGYKLPSPTNGEKFLHLLGNYYFLKKDRAVWNNGSLIREGQTHKHDVISPTFLRVYGMLANKEAERVVPCSRKGGTYV